MYVPAARRAPLVHAERRRQGPGGLADVRAGLRAEHERARPEERVGANGRGGEEGDDR
jgi:hypothetical protein